MITIIAVSFIALLSFAQGSTAGKPDTLTAEVAGQNITLHKLTKPASLSRAFEGDYYITWQWVS